MVSAFGCISQPWTIQFVLIERLSLRVIVRVCKRQTSIHSMHSECITSIPLWRGEFTGWGIYRLIQVPSKPTFWPCIIEWFPIGVVKSHSVSCTCQVKGTRRIFSIFLIQRNNNCTFLFLMKATINKAVNFKLVINGSMEFLVMLKLKIPSINRRNRFVKNAL